MIKQSIIYIAILVSVLLGISESALAERYSLELLKRIDHYGAIDETGDPQSYHMIFIHGINGSTDSWTWSMGGDYEALVAICENKVRKGEYFTRNIWAFDYPDSNLNTDLLLPDLDNYSQNVGDTLNAILRRHAEVGNIRIKGITGNCVKPDNFIFYAYSYGALVLNAAIRRAYETGDQALLDFYLGSRKFLAAPAIGGHAGYKGFPRFFYWGWPMAQNMNPDGDIQRRLFAQMPWKYEGTHLRPYYQRGTIYFDPADRKAYDGNDEWWNRYDHLPTIKDHDGRVPFHAFELSVGQSPHNNIVNSKVIWRYLMQHMGLIPEQLYHAKEIPFGRWPRIGGPRLQLDPNRPRCNMEVTGAGSGSSFTVNHTPTHFGGFKDSVMVSVSSDDLAIVSADTVTHSRVFSGNTISSAFDFQINQGIQHAGIVNFSISSGSDLLKEEEYVFSSDIIVQANEAAFSS